MLIFDACMCKVEIQPQPTRSLFQRLWVWLWHKG